MKTYREIKNMGDLELLKWIEANDPNGDWDELPDLVEMADDEDQTDYNEARNECEEIAELLNQ